MITNIDKTTKRKTRPEHVTLSDAAVARLNRWLEQVTPRLRGGRVTRNEITDWLIMSHDDSLTETEVHSIETRFFDPVKALEWAASEARKSKARGEAINLESFITENVLRATRTRRPKGNANESTKLALKSPTSKSNNER